MTFLLTQETRCTGLWRVWISTCVGTCVPHHFLSGSGRGGGEWKEISCSRHLRGVSVKTEVSKGDSRRPSHLVSRAASKLLLQELASIENEHGQTRVTCATRELKKGGIYCNCTLATFGRLYHSVSETRGNHRRNLNLDFSVDSRNQVHRSLEGLDFHVCGYLCASSFPVRQWEGGRGVEGNLL